MSDDNIKVTVKVRPLIKREKDNKLKIQWRVKQNSIQHIDQTVDQFNFGNYIVYSQFYYYYPTHVRLLY